MSSPNELAAFLRRVLAALDADRVGLTDYAREGMDDLGWEEFDVRAQLRELVPNDWLRCEPSLHKPEDLIWVFTPDFWDDGFLWIRIVERHGLVVVSFHRG